MSKNQTKTPARRPLKRLVVPPAEVIEELRGEITVYRESYREVDGQVRNPAALRTIAALAEAIRIVKRHKRQAEPTDGRKPMSSENRKTVRRPAIRLSAPAAGSAFDFTPRPPGQSYAAKGGLKLWPDEWVCENCAWVKPCETRRKRVYCRKWGFGIAAKSDRACFEETGDMRERRLASQNTKRSHGAENPKA